MSCIQNDMGFLGGQGVGTQNMEINIVNVNNLTSLFMNFEPAHNKTYKKTCATGEDSDQPVRPHSLIRVFADRTCLL